jgi:hypothetical protein
MSQSDEQVEVNDNEVCDDDETEIATHSKILAEMYRIKFYMLGHSDVSPRYCGNQYNNS